MFWIPIPIPRLLQRLSVVAVREAAADFERRGRGGVAGPTGMWGRRRNKRPAKRDLQNPVDRQAVKDVYRPVVVVVVVVI